MKTFKEYFTESINHSDYVTIHMFDGHENRQKGDLSHVDLIGGGHHWVYPWMKKNVVWLEKLKSKEDQVAILMHELIERMLMKYDHWEYAKSHDIATEYEMHYRKGQDHKKLFKKFIDEYFKGDAVKLEDMIRSFEDFKP
jgi:hypothetical protein